MATRRVDWTDLPEADPARTTTRDGFTPPEVAQLLPALEELLACTPADAMLRRAVEIARDRIGLVRVAIFVRDEVGGVMRGTWGTDLEGNSVDEHAVTFDLWEGDRELYERAARGGVYWTVVEDAPIVVHTARASRVVGRGWVCCTPIRIAAEPLGMMFNDAGLTGARLDDARQATAAMLCSVLGTALDVARRRGDPLGHVGRAMQSATAAKVTKLLAADPALSGEELAERLGLSASRVARVFKAAMGVSLVEYRNRLRLERFAALLDRTGDNLLEAALRAGFGSYAQFHRVFVAQHGTTPGKYLRSRAARRK